MHATGKCGRNGLFQTQRYIALDFVAQFKIRRLAKLSLTSRENILLFAASLLSKQICGFWAGVAKPS